MNIAKYIVSHILAKVKYFAKQITYIYILYIYIYIYIYYKIYIYI